MTPAMQAALDGIFQALSAGYVTGLVFVLFIAFSSKPRG
jgi:hypothetical protein